jgi:hypothetical protein
VWIFDGRNTVLTNRNNSSDYTSELRVKTGMIQGVEGYATALTVPVIEEKILLWNNEEETSKTGLPTFGVQLPVKLQPAH